MAAHNGEYLREVPSGAGGTANAICALFSGSQGRRGAPARAGARSAGRCRRGGRGLQPRQQRPRRHASGGRRHGADAGQDRVGAHRGPDAAECDILFTANFNHPEAQGLQVQASYTSGQTGFSVQVDGTAKVSTAFMGLMGLSQISLSTTGTASWNNSKLRVALVLDNTGSMSQSGKI